MFNRDGMGQSCQNTSCLTFCPPLSFSLLFPAPPPLIRLSRGLLFLHSMPCLSSGFPNSASMYPHRSPLNNIKNMGVSNGRVLPARGRGGGGRARRGRTEKRTALRRQLSVSVYLSASNFLTGRAEGSFDSKAGWGGGGTVWPAPATHLLASFSASRSLLQTQPPIFELSATSLPQSSNRLVLCIVPRRLSSGQIQPSLPTPRKRGGYPPPYHLLLSLGSQTSPQKYE
ncbi:hypothetical protein DFH27DRAFT_236620 [Peziza echinospora]|nr:hypothetical protein DFH27DRAFT_236620 [Peziza echinospora]